MAEALRRCPHAVVVSHSFGRYGEASRAFFQILDDFSPLVEPLSLDEGFLDLTGTERLLGPAEVVGAEIKARVANELSLVASVGIAPSKFVAKIASDIDKPDGLRVVAHDEVEAFLHPLPISRLWGVGAVTYDKLTRLGLRTIGDVARYPRSVLRSRLTPAMGEHLADLAAGIDPREVHNRGGAVSVGHEQTFDADITDPRELHSILLGQADRVAARLRASGQCGRVVTLKIKYGDFRVVTRQRSLTDGTCDADEIAQHAIDLLAELDVNSQNERAHAVRLCGVSMAKLEARQQGRQLVLDEESRQKKERLGDTLDLINNRFGDAAIGRAIFRRGPSRKP